MKLAQTDRDSGIAVEGQAMSGLPSRLETVTKKQFITIPQAIAALANMERELDSAESYAQIRKLADAAEALKILFRHVAEVKNKAELVVPAANARIGDEIRAIPKAGNGKTGLPTIGKSSIGIRTPIAHASRKSPPYLSQNSKPLRQRSKILAVMRP
jgi:hypothetical protein